MDLLVRDLKTHEVRAYRVGLTGPTETKAHRLGWVAIYSAALSVPIFVVARTLSKK